MDSFHGQFISHESRPLLITDIRWSKPLSVYHNSLSYLGLCYV